MGPAHGKGVPLIGGPWRNPEHRRRSKVSHAFRIRMRVIPLDFFSDRYLTFCCIAILYGRAIS